MDATTAATFAAIKAGRGIFRKTARGAWVVLGPATWAPGDIVTIATRDGGERQVGLTSQQTATTPDGLAYGMYDYIDIDRPARCDHDWDNRGVCNVCGAENPRYDAMR